MPQHRTFSNTLRALFRWGSAPRLDIYLVFGKQPSPYPELDFIEPIIAVVADERQCYKLEQELSNLEISWETRGVFDCGEHRIADGDVLYLAHSFLKPYATDSAGKELYGIMQSPSPSAAYYRKDTANRPSFICRELLSAR
ncbi:hypothetical protein [Glutamicibacter arilaitensis]|uniref:hypothetical protein n=1 Tax=Glutamicibacter arilaitensis TaxID=256701 RepID=UPI00384B1923